MINVYLLLDSLLSPFCASRQPDRHARDNRTQLTANILNLPKKPETFCLKARSVFSHSPKRFFKSPRPSSDRAELPCTLFPECLSDAPEATAQSGCNDRTIRPQRPHNSAPSNARCKQLISRACRQTIKKLPLLFLIRPADSEKQRQYND